MANNRYNLPLLGADRTVIRSRGCWNCIRWADPTTEIFAKRRAEKGIDTVRALELAGLPPDRVRHGVKRFVEGLSRHGAGVCLVGGSVADFVAAKWLCEKWTGRYKVDGKLDLLADEIRDRLGDAPARISTAGAAIAPDAPDVDPPPAAPVIWAAGIDINALAVEVEAEERANDAALATVIPTPEAGE